jgi:diguanylate cyclase (GGDEF)-like protein/PAS domain S-box-containing protein
MSTQPIARTEPDPPEDQRGDAKRSLYRSEDRLRGILDASDAAFVAVDGEGLVLDWNAEAEAMFGCARGEALGRMVTEVIGMPDRRAEERSFEELFRDECRELTLQGRDGRPFPAQLRISRFPAGEECMFHAFVRDLGPQRQAERGQLQAEERLAHSALHDPLTGLPNRALLLEHLVHALALTRRQDSILAVLLIDVDNLSVVHDSLGHPAGDQLLMAVAGRLQEAVRAVDTLSRPHAGAVAHLGADGFAVVCENLTSPDDAVTIAERAAAAMSPPFRIAGELVYVTLSTGIALSAPGSSAESLLRDSGAAMHRAREAGGATHRLFEPEMHGRARERLCTESELRLAIDARELRLHYQPIVSLADGGMVGVEALVRWQHPRRGLLGPAEFLPLAEQTGLIVPLGRWVLEEAFRQFAAWDPLAGAGPLLRISVNVSGHQLARPETFDEIAELLERTGMPPCRLALEITETVLLDQLETPVETLRKLHGLGIRILLDDFGTGFSSLTYLRRLPLDAIKLDRSFVSQIDRTAADRQIVAATVQLAMALEMGAIAEGVETEEQATCLRELGCHFAQGYHFARPMPPEDLTALIERATPLPEAS